MDLWLIRHPPPLGHTGRCYGQTDLALAENPQEWAALLRPKLSADCAGRVYSSPLQRCARLAEALFPEGKYRLDPRLGEKHFGSWENRLWSEIPRGELDAWAADIEGYVPPGGESVAQLRRRVRNFLSDLCSDAKEVEEEARLLITHGGVIQVILGEILELPVAHWHRFSLEFGAITRVHWSADPGQQRILWLNR